MDPLLAKWIHAGEVHEGLYLMGRTPWWSRGRARGVKSSRDEALCSDHNPHSPSLCAARGGGGRRVGRKLSLGRREK